MNKQTLRGKWLVRACSFYHVHDKMVFLTSSGCRRVHIDAFLNDSSPMGIASLPGVNPRVYITQLVFAAARRLAWRSLRVRMVVSVLLDDFNLCLIYAQ